MRYGIFGGSFDPIHRGHVAAAVEVRRRRGLDRLFLVPAGRPPHKAACAAPFADRLALARLATAGRAGLEVLDLEGRRSGPSYSVDTVEAIRDHHPGAALDLLVGADMLADLPTWRRAPELVAMVTVVAFGRPGAGAAAARRAFAEAFGGRELVWLDLEPVDASSREIRRRLAAGEGGGGLLDPGVEAYILTKGLYKDGG